MPTRLPPIVQADIEQSVPASPGAAAITVSSDAPANPITAASVKTPEKSSPVVHSAPHAAGASRVAEASGHGTVTQPAKRDSGTHLSLWNNRKVTLHAYAKDVWALGESPTVNAQHLKA